MTREQWLLEAIDAITARIFEPVEVIVPKIEVSTNKPGGKSKAWTIDALESQDTETYQIFISSEVWEKSTLIELLFGELVYCIAGRKPTKAFKRAFSLTRAGKRWYPDLSSETHGTLTDIAASCIDYPHIPVVIEEKEKKQTTRNLKVVCRGTAHNEPLIMRGALCTFENGFPSCYCGNNYEPDGWTLPESLHEKTNLDESST